MKIFGYSIEKKRPPVVVEKAKEKVPQKAVGFIGLKTSSGFIEEEFLRELRWPQAGKVYQEMSSNDAVIGGCLYLIETLIKKANWRVKPASDDAGDIEAAKFVESCMFDMQDQTWSEFISDVLSMLAYGFSFHEIVYKIRRGPLEKDPKFKSNYTDGKFGWQELPIRSQASLSEWTYDNSTGKVIEFVQETSQNPVKIPLDGNLLFRTKSNRNNPEGWSILRRAYRSWYFKKYIEELEGIGIERNLAGIPVLAPPPDVNLFDDNNEEMVKMLEWATQLVNELRQDRNHGIVLPNTEWELKLLGSEGSSKSMDTDTIIRRHEARMAMSMLSDVLILGGDRTGSFALAETKQGLFVQSLQALINSIADTLNTKALPKLFAVNNWTLEKLPKILADDLQQPSIKEIALLLRSLKPDISKDQQLFNFILELMQAPAMDAERYNAFLAATAADSEEDGAAGDSDTIDGDLKQSDEAYTEGGE